MAQSFSKKKNNLNKLIKKNQDIFGLKKAWLQGKAALTSSAKPIPSRGLLFEALEPRVLMSADLSYGAATDLSLTFDGVDTYNLVDQANANTVIGTATSTDGVVNITGTAGNDVLRLGLINSPGIIIINFLEGGDDSLVGSSSANAWTVTGANAGKHNNINFSGIESLVGGNAEDVFTFDSAGTLSGGIEGGDGIDEIVASNAANSWTLTGDDAGKLNGTRYAQVEKLSGGSGDDTFSIANTGTLSGELVGGGGQNTLNYAAYTSSITVDLGLGAATGTGDFTDINKVVGGSSASDNLVGFNHDVSWNLTGVNAGNVGDVSFTGIENLSGTANHKDTFIVESTGHLSGVLDGGLGGLDTLDNRNNGVTWNITALNEGKASGLNFTGIENLQGGAGADDFVFADGAKVDGRIDGGIGENSLNYAAYTATVMVNLGTGQATGTGGIAAINSRVIGGHSAFDTLAGPNGDVIWNLTGVNAGIVANVVFTGIENLVGAANNKDKFVVKQGGSLSGVLDGGAGGTDRLVFDKNGSVVIYAPRVPDSGSIDLGWVSIAYAGLEPGGFLSNDLLQLSDFTDPDNIKIFGHVLAPNDLHLTTYSPATPKLLQISSAYDPDEIVIFNSPANSLTINMAGLSANKLSIGDVGSSMTLPGRLTIIGGLGNDIIEQAGSLVIQTGGLSIDGLSGHDIVTLNGAVDVNGGLTINASGGLKDEITLNGTIAVTGGDVLIAGGLFADTITLNGVMHINGGAFTIDGSPTPEIPLVGQDQVFLNGYLDTQGGNVRVDAANITLGGGDVSTRKFDAVAPGVSTGDSGAITFSGVKILLQPDSALLADVGASTTLNAGDVTLSVSVTDLTGALPIDVIPSSNPSITLQSGAVIKGGAVKLSAYKVNQTQTSLLPLTILSVQSKNVTIELTGATIEGSDVTIDASAEDKNLLASSGPETLVDNLASPITTTYVATPLMVSIPLVLQAVSVMMRQASTSVTLTNSHIVSSGNVSIAANTTVSSEAQPAGAMDPTKGKYNPAGIAKGTMAPFAAGYSKADGSAVTLVTGASTISAAGDVAIESNTDTTASVNAVTLVNSAPAGKTASSKSITNTTMAHGISIAVTDSITQSTSTVDQAVTINAGGTVTVNAVGAVSNEASANTYVYIDGSGALGIAVGTDKSDIKTTVNGTIKAGAVHFGSQDAGQFVGTNFDLTKNTIEIQGHGFEPGQEIALAGETYRVIVVDENTIQLAHGSAIKLDATGTDPNAIQTLARANAKTFEAADAVDANTNSITLAGHGLTTGQRVSYHALTSDGADIGGLTGGADYYVLRIDADHLKLGTDIAPEGTSPETFAFGTTTYYVVDLADATALKNTVSFDPTVTTSKGEAVFDNANDTIVFDADHNFYTGQAVTYTAAAPLAGLSNGGVYYIIKLAGASDRVQLAISKANAEAVAPVHIILGPSAGAGTQTLTGRQLYALAYDEAPIAFNPQAAINDTDSSTSGSADANVGTTITFTAPHGWQTGDAVVYHVDPTLQHEVGVIRHTNLDTADVVLGNINPAGLTVDGEPVVNTADGTISFDGPHPFVTGQRVTYSSGGGSAIGGLANGDYFVIDGAPGDLVSANKIQLALTRADAFVGNAVALSSTGSGSQHSFTANSLDTADNLLIVQNNTFHTGQKVQYSAGGSVPIGGLVDNTDYYVIRVAGTNDMIRLASTLADASAQKAIDLSAGASGTTSMLTTDQTVTPFDALRTEAVVDLATNTLFLPDHGFQMGEVVTLQQ